MVQTVKTALLHATTVFLLSALAACSGIVDKLLDALRDQGAKLRADAVIPAQRTGKPAEIAAGAGAYRLFYVFDDGRTQVLEARAIRYQ